MPSLRKHAFRVVPVIAGGFLVFGLLAYGYAQYRAPQAPPGDLHAAPGSPAAGEDRVVKSDAEWRAQLTPAQYYVLRQKGTERAWTGKYARGKPKGVFTCGGCGAPLFSSNHKFESGTGWPSFYRPIRDEALATEWDYSGFSPRVEVLCRRCGGHLGHVFNDGPAPTGLRYCMNSAALDLKPFSAFQTNPASEPANAGVPAPAAEADQSTAAPNPPEPSADPARPR